MTDTGDLSDAELCDAVAREVLGWDGRYYKRIDPLDRVLLFFSRKTMGNLSLNWSGIGQVVEAMREDCYWLQLFDEDTTWAAYWQDGNHGPRYKARRATPARAVFEAALAAVRSEDGDDA